jgi:hypothetical protein
MSHSLSFRQKIIATALAALTCGAGIVAQAAPAEARGRGNRDAAIALGLFGAVAAGLLIAGSRQSHARSYDEDYSYHPQRFVHEEPVVETRDVGPRLIHEPRYRAPHWRQGHSVHGFHPGYSDTRPRGRHCSIERQQVEGRGGQIFVREVRVCS